MKNLFIIISILFLFSGISEAQKITMTGPRLVSREAAFEIVFPTGFPLPKHEITKDNMVMFTTETNRGACLVSFNTFEHSLFETKTIEQILSDAIDGYLKDGSVLVSKKDISLGGYKGKTVKFDTKDGNNIYYNRFDCYVYGDQLLQVAFVAYEKKELDKKDLADYFSSLTLIDKKLESHTLGFAPEDDDYTVYLPHGFTKPTGESSEIDTDYGKVPTLMYTVENKTGACILASSQYPEKLFDNKTTDQILEDAMNGAVKSQDFVVLSKHYLLRDENAGLSYIVKTKSKNSPIYIRYEYCVRLPKLYQVAYSTYSLKELNSPEVLNYFKSFELSK